MFSDQSRFCLHLYEGRVLFKRLPSERFLDACISEHDRYREGSMMVWAGIMSKWCTALVCIQGTMTSKRYVQEIVPPHIVPLAERLGHRFIFQHDNARPHTFTVGTTALRDINVLDWPAGHVTLRACLGRAWYSSASSVSKASSNTFAEHWEQIEMATVRHLFLRMPRRVAELVRRQGRHTRY